MSLSNRDDEIRALHEAGDTHQMIADALGRSKNYIGVRLREMGLSKAIAYQMPTNMGMWDLPEDQLRIAIAKRAARGAKAALSKETA